MTYLITLLKARKFTIFYIIISSITSSRDGSGASSGGAA
jgi:hypothetical protein